MKKKSTLGLAGLLMISCCAACSRPDQTTPNLPKLEEENGYTFEVLYDTEKEFALSSGKSVEIPVNADIGDKSYLWLDLETDVNLVGHIYYENSEDATQTNVEKFFVEKGAEDFMTFLDSYRIGAFGAFKKKLVKITLENVDGVTGEVEVDKVGISDRTYDKTQELYIEDGYLKMGTSLSVGGAIRHIEKLNAGVVEYIDEKGYVCIDSGVDKGAVNTVTDSVNLVNIHDLGREIQQSYYSTVTEENGYAPTEEVLYDAGLLYNPVQAGSAGDKESQIIDYTVSQNTLHIKVRPTEWFFDNILSDSYMENTYALDGKGTLRVTNRFVNFSQFKDMKNTSSCNQELPAIYIVHPLNYFYCETTEGTIFDSTLGPLPTTPTKTGLNHEVEGTYHYTIPKSAMSGDWYAFVNEKKFGVGIYMPNADCYNASRGAKSSYYEALDNSSYNSIIYNLHGYKYFPSAYVTNYNYLSSSSRLRMLDFVPLQYEYAVAVGSVEELGTTFGKMAKDKTITNEGLKAWSVK